MVERISAPVLGLIRLLGRNIPGGLNAASSVALSEAAARKFILVDASWPDAKSKIKTLRIAGWKDDSGAPLARADVLSLKSMRPKSNRDLPFLLCSGSGFENAAVLEARRQGILPVTYERKSRGLLYRLETAVVGKFMGVGSWALSLRGGEIRNEGILIDEHSPPVHLEGKPLLNWLHLESRKALLKIGRSGLIAISYTFRGTKFLQGRKAILPEAAELLIAGRKKIRYQRVSAALDDGLRDWILDGASARSNPAWSRLSHEADSWVDLGENAAVFEDPNPDPQMFFVEPIPCSEEAGVPKMGKHVVNRETRFHF